MMVYILSPIAVGQRQEDLCEPGASLLFIFSFRPAELHSETLSWKREGGREEKEGFIE